MAEAADHPYSRVHAYWAVGFRALRQGDLLQAIPVLEQALALAREAYLRLWIILVSAPLGAAYTLAGRSADALPLLTQAVEQAMAMRFMLHLALWVVWLDEASTQVQRALEFSRAHQEHRGDDHSRAGPPSTFLWRSPSAALVRPYPLGIIQCSYELVITMAILHAEDCLCKTGIAGLDGNSVPG
jgi:hypothetical protein